MGRGNSDQLSGGQAFVAAEVFSDDDLTPAFGRQRPGCTGLSGVSDKAPVRHAEPEDYPTDHIVFRDHPEPACGCRGAAVEAVIPIVPHKEQKSIRHGHLGHVSKIVPLCRKYVISLHARWCFEEDGLDAAVTGQSGQIGANRVTGDWALVLEEFHPVSLGLLRNAHTIQQGNACLYGDTIPADCHDPLQHRVSQNGGLRKDNIAPAHSPSRWELPSQGDNRISDVIGWLH